MHPFVLNLPRQILFGIGAIEQLPETAHRFGKRAALVTGARSFRETPKGEDLVRALSGSTLELVDVKVPAEPTVSFIDESVAWLKREQIEFVISIGGGSSIDAGKAIAAMMTVSGSVQEYLEGVGSHKHPGATLPFIACPTTAGTGSEATKNAVIRGDAPSVFKKSLRHDQFIPTVAVVDPMLTSSCPANISATCGMDAITQLIESYVSIKTQPATDSLIAGALPGLHESLYHICCHGASDLKHRARLSYAALISGISLANAGLGVVHGIAAVLGGMFEIPHGAACAALLAPATRMTVEKLKASGADGKEGLLRYARVGSLLLQRENVVLERDLYDLVQCLGTLGDELRIPGLAHYGVTAESLSHIAATASSGSNPIPLTPDEILRVLTTAH